MQNNKFTLVILIFLLSFIFFKVNKNEKYKTEEVKTVDKALIYLGTPYKFGGTTSKGMDCSGLVYTVFKDELKITLPRSSSSMSSVGKKVNYKEIKKGDLLFFDIARLKGDINHVGLVTSVTSEEIKFIHSSTSKGVVITSMNESYWKDAFAFAKRINVDY
ncbi:C40 family peptidase [Tenacibaculum sp. ZS6-P6]|uniref:C40 family peptidase n=1 Tax=Tenacibaculum sp. ZS6-P6 TaxID=3447503 RepID=UPI003F9C1F6F